MKAILLYLPALHQGYLNFFNRYRYPILVINSSLIKEVPRLERDIRGLTPEEGCNALKGVGLDAEIFKEEDLKTFNSFVMPDEEISRLVADRYLKGKEVKFVPVFLRWDRHNSEKSNLVVPNEVISKEEFEIKVMKRALGQKEKSLDWWRQVGAVLVKDGRIILESRNRALPREDIHNILGDPRSNFDYGERIDLSKFNHAEAGIIARAAKDGISTKDSTLFVTTFPCPTCAKLIAEAGISQVCYSEGYSLLDAKDIFDSYGIKVVRVVI